METESALGGDNSWIASVDERLETSFIVHSLLSPESCFKFCLGPSEDDVRVGGSGCGAAVEVEVSLAGWMIFFTHTDSFFFLPRNVWSLAPAWLFDISV